VHVSAGRGRGRLRASSAISAASAPPSSHQRHSGQRNIPPALWPDIISLLPSPRPWRSPSGTPSGGHAAAALRSPSLPTILFTPSQMPKQNVGIEPSESTMSPPAPPPLSISPPMNASSLVAISYEQAPGKALGGGLTAARNPRCGGGVEEKPRRRCMDFFFLKVYGRGRSRGGQQPERTNRPCVERPTTSERE
jgi:hypothetical protein